MFYAYVGRQGDILTPTIDLSLDERIEQLEYLIPREPGRSRTGWSDYPRYWLATLYGERAELERAGGLLKELLEERQYRSVEWMRSYERVLRAGGHDPEALSDVEERLRRAGAAQAALPGTQLRRHRPHRKTEVIESVVRISSKGFRSRTSKSASKWLSETKGGERHVLGGKTESKNGLVGEVRRIGAVRSVNHR